MTGPRFNTFIDSTERSQWRTLRELVGHMWPKGRADLKLRVLFAFLCLVASKLINVYVPFLLKRSVDALSVEPSLLVLPLGLILAYGTARILSQVFGELRDYLFAKVGQHAQRLIASETFHHLHHLSLAFHLERQTGGLSRVIERGTRGIQFVLNFLTFNILPTLLEIFLVTGVLLKTFRPAFGLITFFTISLYIFFTLYITDWRVKYRRTMNQKDSEANTKAIDSLLNYETVKYFNNEGHEFRRYEEALKSYEKAALKSQTSLSLLNTVQTLIIGIGLGLVMYLAAAGVVQHEMSVGDFILVNTFLIQLYLPLNFLGFVYRETKQSLIDMDKMFELLEVNPDVKDAPDARPLVVNEGRVEFKNVTFSYGPGRVILKNISFVVDPGKTVAIVGPSGAGKSTISRLLFRFYDVGAGSITIDGTDLRSCTQISLRRAIGIVPQDTVLFNDSIGYNILYGNVESTQSDVVQAARLAQIDRFIESLPEKYDTPVGERGLKLSGGEKQRVAIARTILKNPPILIFDEATSALDSHTEKEIQSALREVARDHTTLVIAHRLSTIVDADEILVLKDGMILERGRHQDLLSKRGEYASLWERQQKSIQQPEEASR